MLRLAQRSIPGGKSFSLTRLHFSTSPPVKQDTFFDKLKRWTKRLSPLLAFGFVSTFVIGNLSIRHYTESICPAYVEFLRTHYGFEDEDKVERARVAAIEAGHSRPVTANVNFENGECMLGVVLDGDKKYASVIKDLEEQHKSRICSIIFNDSEEQQQDDETSSLFTSVSTEFPDTSSPLTGSEVRTILSELQEFAPSRWDQLPSVSADGNAKSKNPLLNEISTETVLKRYDNLMPLYAMERASIAEVRESMRLRNSSAAPSYYSAPRQVNNAVTSPVVDPDIIKHEAIQTIARLEEKVLQLKKDMQSGSRDVDSVMSDIHDATAEITALKRRHVNRFYYF